MSDTLQKTMLHYEIRNSMMLLKRGLAELVRPSDSADFYHLPILLLSSGMERFMKVILCLQFLEEEGRFPDRKLLSKKPQQKRPTPTHDLIWLLNKVTEKCFSEEYIHGPAVAKADLDFLKSDKKFLRILKILSDFASSARYYNLNVVLDDVEPGPCPDDEWQKFEMEIIQEDPDWVIRLQDPVQKKRLDKELLEQITISCETFTRALSRLMTLGNLGEYARQISGNTFHFLTMMDEKLGKTDYHNLKL